MDKKYVYIPASLADKVENLIDDEKMVDAAIEQYFADSMKEIRSQLESLDDFTTEYKGLMIAARKAFKTASDEAVEKSYQVWEAFDAAAPSTRKKIQEVRDELKPLKQDLGEIKTALDKIDVYRLGEILKLIRELNESTPETRSMLGFLMNNYKKE